MAMAIMDMVIKMKMRRIAKVRKSQRRISRVPRKSHGKQCFKQVINVSREDSPPSEQQPQQSGSTKTNDSKVSDKKVCSD